MPTGHWTGLLPLLLLFAGACAVGEAGTPVVGSVRFVVLGDAPYDSGEEARLVGPITRRIAKEAVPFVAVFGDIKSGREACTDDLLERRRDQYAAVHPQGAVFYTPGDNDWTDCDRERFGDGARSELERLSFLRRTFFGAPPRRPDDSTYARQADFPENARWQEGGVVFVTLHIVGTNNGRQEILKDDLDTVLDAVEAREEAARTWLEAAASLAAKAHALVVIIHGDPTQPAALAPCTADNRQDCDPYSPFRTGLADHAASLDRPTLLIHGDTHPYCLDVGFGGERAPKLWRLNAWGDFQKPGDGTLVTVQPDDPAGPFVARTLLGGKLAEACE
jgi:hypothetical protein